MIPAGGKGPARDVSGEASRAAGQTCWLCGQLISDPPHIIGQYVAGSYRVAHRRCWQTLGEMELQLAGERDLGLT